MKKGGRNKRGIFKVRYIHFREREREGEGERERERVQIVLHEIEVLR